MTTEFCWCRQPIWSNSRIVTYRFTHLFKSIEYVVSLWDTCPLIYLICMCFVDLTPHITIVGICGKRPELVRHSWHQLPQELSVPFQYLPSRHSHLSSFPGKGSVVWVPNRQNMSHFLMFPMEIAVLANDHCGPYSGKFWRHIPSSDSSSGLSLSGLSHIPSFTGVLRQTSMAGGKSPHAW